MKKPGQVLSYFGMCNEEEANLRQGMNFRLHGKESVILMSLRQDAPYADRVEDDGRILIYEGHDAPRKIGGSNPKTIDQPEYGPNGSPTQNGLFFRAATKFKNRESDAEIVKAYEKVRPGIWVYNGTFRLTDTWLETVGGRKVFKFRLELTSEEGAFDQEKELDHNRIIPAWVKIAVWERDKGRCVKCGRKDNLQFDHIIPYSKGGSSLVPENIQLLCARHNLEKRAKIN